MTTKEEIEKALVSAHENIVRSIGGVATGVAPVLCAAVLGVLDEHGVRNVVVLAVDQSVMDQVIGPALDAKFKRSTIRRAASSPCPHCQTEQYGISMFSGTDEKAVEGSAALCSRCCGVSILNADTTRRLPTPEEQAMMDADPEFQKTIARARHHIRRTEP